LLQKTLTANNKVNLSSQYVAVAGVDKNAVPRILRTDEKGGLLLGGSGALPTWETFSLEYFGTTNNIARVIYRVGIDEVARVELTYRAGGAADNDILTGGNLILPVP
jgi:hypothetical protein